MLLAALLAVVTVAGASARAREEHEPPCEGRLVAVHMQASSAGEEEAGGLRLTLSPLHAKGPLQMQR